MGLHSVRSRFNLPLSLALTALAAVVLAQEKQSSHGVILQDRVIAGSRTDSLEVRHLVLKGSNEEIGKTLAQIAKERYQVQLLPSDDPLRTRAQRRYMEKNYPILHERMRGVAAAFGQQLEDDSWNYSWLSFSVLKAGCSVLYLPPRCMASGTSLVSRDYDFTTGSFTGPLLPGMLHPTARPYLVELHPDRGYSSVAMVAYDLLSGVLDGINSEGLTVALLADDELMAKNKMEPSDGPQAGLGVLQTPRMLLDTCATVAEAKEALLQTKQYYEFIPVHYLIADRFGNAFVWEYSHAHNKEFIIENPNQPLVTTNFSLHRHLDKARPPSAEQAKNVCPRYCLLTEQLAAQPGKLTEEFIKETHKKVDAVQPKAISGLRPPNRTFWHALYCPEERRVRISYYLRDEAAPDQPNQVRIVRSEYQEFRLQPTEIGKGPSTQPARQPNAEAPATPAPLADLQGTWKVTALEADGKPTELPGVDYWWSINGDQVRYGGQELAKLNADTTTKPWCIDLKFHDPERAYEAIYTIDGDMLKLCINRATDGIKERPTEFATKGKPEWRLLVLQRDKERKGDSLDGLGGYVGIAIMAKEGGDALVITDVLKDSPAMKAGAKKDDLLLKIGGQEVTKLQSAIQAIRQAKPGSELTLRIKRGESEQEVTVKVGVVPFFLLD